MAQFKPCFDDLPDDMVIEIFNHLSTDKLLATETVSRTWSRCVGKALNRVEVVVFGEPHLWHCDSNQRCRHLQWDNRRRMLFIELNLASIAFFKPYDKCRVFNADQVDSMVPTLKRCPNIRCLVLGDHFGHYFEFDSIESLAKVWQALPQVDCIFCGNFWFDDLYETFDDDKWLAFCQEIGPRLEHLTIDRQVKEENIINNLITASVNLKLLYFDNMSNEKVHYFEPLLRNKPLLNSIDLRIKFSGQVAADGSDIDADVAAIISRAKNLTIHLTCLYSVAKRFRTFGRLNRLRIDKNDAENMGYPVIAFPALQHLNSRFEHRDSVEIVANYMSNYNLPCLKSLEVQLTDDWLTPLTGQLISLEMLVFNSSMLNLPTDSLLILNQHKLIHLEINHFIYSADDMPQVVRLFEVVAKMNRLKRCRINIAKGPGFKPYLVPKQLQHRLFQAKANLRKALPFVDESFLLYH